MPLLPPFGNQISFQGALHDEQAEPFSEFCSCFGEQAYLLKSEGRVLPGPQVRGTGGIVIVVWEGYWGRGHPQRGVERVPGPVPPASLTFPGVAPGLRFPFFQQARKKGAQDERRPYGTPDESLVSATPR
jgi:hypothetical protein